RGFLRNISMAGNGNTVQQLNYSYFPNGSLQSRTAQLRLLSVTEEFKYDPLNRLHEWTASSSPNATPHVSTVILDQLFKYDDLGNLMLRSVVTGPGQTRTYQYGQNHAGPHAVTSVNSNVYQYDLSGN